MNMINKTVIICGKSGSGKTYLMNLLKNNGFRCQNKITTRPLRTGEVNGIDYDFIDNEQFDFLLLEDKIKVHQHFIINGQIWNYGITKENLKKNNLFILTPYEINQIPYDELKDFFIIFLDIEESIRRIRLTNRYDNNDSIDRRIISDDEDFKNFNCYNIKITNPEFTLEILNNLGN